MLTPEWETEDGQQDTDRAGLFQCCQALVPWPELLIFISDIFLSWLNGPALLELVNNHLLEITFRLAQV